MFGRQRHHLLRHFLTQRCFAPILVHDCTKESGKSKTERMLQPLSVCERFIGSRQRLVRVAEVPQGPSAVGQTVDSWINSSLAERQLMITLIIIQRVCCLQVLPREKK